MRTMPMMPRIAPSTKAPAGSSRAAIRPPVPERDLAHGPGKRMMREVACDPELPPELIMRGMNRVSTIALFELRLIVLHRAGGQHLRQKTGTQSPACALCGSARRSRSSGTAQSSASYAAELLNVLCALGNNGIDDVIDRNDCRAHARLRRRRVRQADCISRAASRPSLSIGQRRHRDRVVGPCH